MRDSKRGLKIILVALFFGAIAVYALYQAQDILAGPQIILSEPENGTTTTLSLITVSGEILRSDAITLNDRQIFVDLEGRFSERLLLMEGYNILTIKATDREGREALERLEIIRVRE